MQAVRLRYDRVFRLHIGVQSDGIGQIEQGRVETAKHAGGIKRFAMVALLFRVGASDRHVDHTRIQHRGYFLLLPAAGQNANTGRDLPQSRRQIRQKQQLHLARHAQPECAALRRRIEHIRRQNRRLRLPERLPHRAGQMERPRRRLHLLPHADEKLILKQGAQSRDIMAHGRLLDFQPPRGARHVHLLHHRIESDEEIEVEGTEIEMIDSLHKSHRFDCWLPYT